MRIFIFIVCLVSFVFAGSNSDTLFDTAVTTVSWKDMPRLISLDRKTGNVSAEFTNAIFNMIPLDSSGRVPVWTDSAQHADSAYGQPMDTLINVVFTHCKKYYKKISKTKQTQ